MRILYVFRALAYWGGIERVLVDKMNHLAAKSGYEIFMLTTDQGDHPVPYQLVPEVHLEDLNINFHHQYRYGLVKRLIVARQKRRLFEKRLSQRLQAIQPDVMVCTTANCVDINILAKLKGDTPLIVESHSIYRMTLEQKGWRNRYADYMFRKGISKAQMIVALTDGDANDWKSEFPHVCVVPDMVNLNKGAMSSLENKRVVWVGRFDYQKRPMEAIRIWQEVYPKFPDWHLDLYGEGDEREELETVANGLNMNIHIHKPTEHIFDAYRQSSILISTSLFEPFGLVIPEAMSCGLPVVAYDCPYGPSALIKNDENGFLIVNNDVQAFANSICMLMGDVLMRKRVGKSAMVSTDMFSPERIMPIWNHLFQEIAKSKQVAV